MFPVRTTRRRLKTSGNIAVKRKTEIDVLIVLDAARTKEARSLTDCFEIKRKFITTIRLVCGCRNQVSKIPRQARPLSGHSQTRIRRLNLRIHSWSPALNTYMWHSFHCYKNCFAGENHRLSEIDDLYKHAVAQGAHEE
ncbi:hypothetical protein BC938DRAFT_479253 [Jimgerdemannia flammicorona]|uniref:Uncharacterized protein n=1 Tax=Jimgerdemannia flammicorona TaxID=994334 RepID=A0A433QXW8_9FUNG|nr:hypothetical protein BC938DRAFT_479253 [Jimgerdemannia flammicorona]